MLVICNSRMHFQTPQDPLMGESCFVAQGCLHIIRNLVLMLWWINGNLHQHMKTAMSSEVSIQKHTFSMACIWFSFASTFCK